MNDKIARMKELIDLLNKASMLYYQKSTPMMTDYEYDKLYDELVSLEKETNMVFSNSPTINVEPTVSTELEKTTHPHPMLSLSKTKNPDDLVSFIGNKEGLLSWKLDGLTIVLTYENGKLVSGVTRGNGVVLKQSISSGEKVDEGSAITITVNKLVETKTGTVTINVKEITGYKDKIPDKDDDGNEVEKDNEPKDVSFKVTVNGEQITRNNETVKENETAKTVNVSGQGNIQIKITIDGATTSYTMDLDKTTTLSIP